LADRIELTEIHAAPTGDTVLDAFDPVIWQEIKREDHAAENGHPAYSFVSLLRKDAA
jgi:dihydrofolate reductase